MFCVYSPSITHSAPCQLVSVICPFRQNPVPLLMSTHHGTSCLRALLLWLATLLSRDTSGSTQLWKCLVSFLFSVFYCLFPNPHFCLVCVLCRLRCVSVCFWVALVFSSQLVSIPFALFSNKFIVTYQVEKKTKNNV